VEVWRARPAAGKAILPTDAACKSFVQLVRRTAADYSAGKTEEPAMAEPFVLEIFTDYV
jgi:hypothetical protein